MNEYIPNPVIVDRAVSIWVSLLKTPKYDNLGKNSGESAESRFANGMASVLCDMLPKNNTPDILAAFAKELKDILTNGHDVDFKNGSAPYHMVPMHLSVDYGPDYHLADAAKRSGLKMEFPWKTSMYIQAEHLYFRNGYGSELEYHYPMKDGTWFVTSLSGSDVEKIKALIEAKVLNLDLTPVQK